MEFFCVDNKSYLLLSRSSAYFCLQIGTSDIEMIIFFSHIQSIYAKVL